MMPPTSKRMGPPPGSTPQGLTSMLPKQSEPAPSEPMEGMGASPTPPGGGGGLKDVYDELAGVLDSLAEILPDQAVEIDQIKTQLAEILGKALSGGAEFTGRTQQVGQMKSSLDIPV